MYFTLETDYAIRIVDFLARENRRVGAQLISERNDVTLRFSLKILRKLVQSGIVRSYKGAQGGYEIAMPLDQISIADILETIEGPYLINRCLGIDHVCARSATCPYHQLFEEISQDVRAKLAAATMDKIARGQWK